MKIVHSKKLYAPYLWLAINWWLGNLKKRPLVLMSTPAWMKEVAVGAGGHLEVPSTLPSHSNSQFLGVPYLLPTSLHAKLELLTFWPIPQTLNSLTKLHKMIMFKVRYQGGNAIKQLSYVFITSLGMFENLMGWDSQMKSLDWYTRI